jgi:hypothetical protein
MQTFKNSTDNSIWEFDDDVIDIFSLPNTPVGLVPFTRPTPTEADIEAARVAEADLQRTSLMSVATVQISILTDATDPDIVDSPSAGDAALLVLWKKYRQAIRAVVTTTNPITWPEQPANAAGT